MLTMPTMLTRREILKGIGLATLASSLRARVVAYPGPFCLFSKHLPDMKWDVLARTVKELGFDGVDLTVRPGGHVLPERVTTDLPLACRAIRNAGLEIPMITTGLTRADQVAAATFAAAAQEKILFLKPGYWKYQFNDVRSEISKWAEEYRPLVELGRQGNVQVGFHNHSGNLGAPLWDVAPEIDKLEAKYAGYYFDVRHAVVEGGDAGWKAAFNLVSSRLKMVAMKDFYWEKSSKGWKIVDCPLGEGMVDWKLYLRKLRESRFDGPISLHVEYEVGGRTAVEKESRMIAAISRDFSKLKSLIKEASEPA